MPLALASLIVVAALLALAWGLQRRLMYFPFGDVPPPDAVGLRDAEPVRFRTPDGLVLHGWFVRATRPARTTVIVFNGNGGNRAFRAPLAAALRARGLHVLLFDYRGYGDNPGSPSESGLLRDARAARAYVGSRGDVDPDRIVYFGESLGTAVAAALAAEARPAALILRSPFASMTEIAGVHYPVLAALIRVALRDRYDTIGRIAQVRVPLLVVAGDRDRIIPIEHSRRLYDAASSPKTFVVIRGADHNDDALLDGPELMEAVVGFLAAPPLDLVTAISGTAPDRLSEHR